MMARSGILRAGLFATCTLVLAVTSTRAAFTTILAEKNFSAALFVSPDNAVALTKQGDLQFDTIVQGRGNLAALNSSARTSIRSQAINATGLRQIAYSIGQNGDIGRARAAIDVSSRLSRRDFGARFWLIQEAASRNDLRGALAQYDVALKTSHDSSKFLYPRLAVALNDPAIRHEFVGLVHSNPEWMADFLSFAISTSSDPTQLTALAKEADGLPTTPNGVGLDQNLLQALVAKRDYLQARDYYLSLKGSDRAILTSVELDSPAAVGGANMMAWQLTDGSTIGASRARGGGLSLFASSGENAVVAQKILFASPGPHQLHLNFRDVSLAPSAGLQLQLSCLAQIGALPVWQSRVLQPAPNSSFDDTFSINAGCAVQSFDIRMIGGDGQSSTEIGIGAVHLR